MDSNLGLILLWVVVLGFGSGSGGFARNLPILSFEDGYSHLFGDGNLKVMRDGKAVDISLDERTGSGFISQDVYRHGFFSASIKLPGDYTAGVVVAFYMSNGDKYEDNHDEIDFEFLGNIRGKNWRFQTNVYGNGSTSRGREERYGLWFDPSEDFHDYSIHWTEHRIVFYVDDVPIREVKRNAEMGGDFPSKPMSLYATIWDGSAWATNGGKYKVNYKYAPFVAGFSDFVLHGCAVDPEDPSSECDVSPSRDFALMSEEISGEQIEKMGRVRRKHMQYSYCYDRSRYKIPLPECVIDLEEANHLRRYDGVTFGGDHHRHHRGGRRHRRSRGVGRSV